jgi:hypothetical protein
MYKHAFDCKKCPQRGGPDGCPCWIELVWKNDITGETVVEKGCYFQLTPKLILEAVKAANISSEHACQMRNGFQYLADFAEKYPMLEEG